MQIRQWTGAWWMAVLMTLALLTPLAGCDSNYGRGGLCAPGAAVECSCDDGVEGFRICSPQRVFGACECARDGQIFDPLDEIPDDNEPFELQVEPETLRFEPLEPGQSQSNTVTVTNNGPGTARVNLSLEEELSAEDDRREFSWGEGTSGEAVVLSPGESMTVEVSYNAQDTIEDRGTLWVHAHDGKVSAVALDATAVLPDIEGPVAVDVGTVITGGATRRSAFVRNAGGAPLVISDFELDASDEFTLCWTDPADSDRLLCPGQDPDALPLTLEPDDVVRLQLTYRPTEEGPDDGLLTIVSNDPDEARYTIDITAGGASPCIDASVTDLDFGDVPVSQSATREVVLRNCAEDRNLTIASMRIAGDASFTLINAPQPRTILEPGQEVIFVTQYSPRSEATHRGRVEVYSNDPERSPLTIDLLGRGIPFNNCPQAVATAQIERSGQSGILLDAIPLDTILLSAEGSFDPENPDADVLAYEWTMVEQPADSTTRLAPNPNVPNPTLFLDLAGRYVLELRVIDDEGLASCVSARVVIQATSDEDIHIQLVWDTPRDLNQSDSNGTDLDLHLTHPNGTWGDPQWDCHWITPEPNWGGPGPSDDPSLDIDDTNGSGPENINLDNPENETYSVGVHYYSDNGFGSSDVTTRIFLGGVLIFDSGPTRMRDRQFWHVADVIWGEVRVEEVGLILDEIPEP